MLIIRSYKERILTHIPLGNPEAVQWHCAAVLNELQNSDELVGVATGHDA